MSGYPLRSGQRPAYYRFFQVPQANTWKSIDCFFPDGSRCTATCVADPAGRKGTKRSFRGAKPSLRPHFLFGKSFAPWRLGGSIKCCGKRQPEHPETGKRLSPVIRSETGVVSPIPGAAGEHLEELSSASSGFAKEAGWVQWNDIRALLLGTTVVLQLNQGTLPRSGCNRSRVPFLGTFLGTQKGTNKCSRYR